MGWVGFLPVLSDLVRSGAHGADRLGTGFVQTTKKSHAIERIRHPGPLRNWIGLASSEAPGNPGLSFVTAFDVTADQRAALWSLARGRGCAIACAARDRKDCIAQVGSAAQLQGVSRRAVVMTATRRRSRPLRTRRPRRTPSPRASSWARTSSSSP